MDTLVPFLLAEVVPINHVLIQILIAVIIFAVLWWAITQIPLPPPIGRILQIVLIVIGVIWIVELLAAFL